jgi:hypothetical protein
MHCFRAWVVGMMVQAGGIGAVRKVWVGCIIIMAVGLSGCATKYQDMGFAGGVAAEPVMTDTYRISCSGKRLHGSRAS